MMMIFRDNNSFVFVAAFLFYLIKAEGLTETTPPLPDHKQLIEDLMNNYGSRAVRPRLKHTDTVRVALYFTPNILSSFDEQSQKLSVVGTLYMAWVDEYLMWDPDKYGGVTLISLRSEDIWMPDIAVTERLDVDSAVVNLFQPYLIVNNTGFVTFFQQTDLTIYCRLDMSKFPFDTQICEMRLLSYSYDSNQVVLSFANTSASNEDTFRKNGVWNLQDIAVYEVETLYTCCPFPYVEVHYEIILERIGSFYIFSIWIPCGLLSILELTVFLMHPNSGEKVTLSVNNVLAFILFQQIVVESMPRSGDDSPIIVAYFSAMIAISCASVLASAIVLRVYHHNPISPVPSFIRCLFCSSTVDSSITTTSGQSSETLNSDLSCTQEGSLHGQLATIMETPGSEVTADDQCVGEEKYVTEMETNKIARKEMNNADWMKLALVLDKVFLACAIVAMVGTLSYCFFKFQL